MIQSMAGTAQWAFCYAVFYGFARWLPVSYKPYAFGARRIRARLARGLLRSCGQNVNLEHGADVGSGRLVSLGDRSGIGVGAILVGTVEIGNDVMMGPNCQFFARDHAFDRTDIPMIQQGYERGSKIVVEDDVWIGASVIFLGGVTVGAGCVVAAGSVVTRNVPPRSIVGGNPARVIRMRG